MYTKSDFRSVEPVCYEEEHIARVWKVIKRNLPGYFDRFIETASGSVVTTEHFKQLQAKFGIGAVKEPKRKDLSQRYKDIIKKSIDDFEKDRQDYKNILDQESLEEYEYDLATFKSEILKNKCPIIRKTFQNKKAKELDKYRADFSRADAGYLHDVVVNLTNEAEKYIKAYDCQKYEMIDNYRDLNMAVFDSDECTAYGVIGGGIKSLMLYKLYPQVFSNRSRMSLWALWYLTENLDFGCKTDSEFIMIDLQKVITQQNYFYPYELFNFYAFKIYQFLKERAELLNVEIDPEYRYVVVDEFLSYVAKEHEDAINLFQSQIREGAEGSNA